MLGRHMQPVQVLIGGLPGATGHPAPRPPPLKLKAYRSPPQLLIHILD